MLTSIFKKSYLRRILTNKRVSEIIKNNKYLFSENDKNDGNNDNENDDKHKKETAID